MSTKSSSIWEAQDLESYGARPWPCSITRVGQKLTAGFSRDDGGKYKSSYKMNDIFDSWGVYNHLREWISWGYDSDRSTPGADNIDNNFNNKFEKFYPPGKKDFDCPKNGLVCCAASDDRGVHIGFYDATYQDTDRGVQYDVVRIEQAYPAVKLFQSQNRDTVASHAPLTTVVRPEENASPLTVFANANTRNDVSGKRYNFSYFPTSRYQFSFDKLPSDAEITIKIDRLVWTIDAYDQDYWSDLVKKPTFYFRVWTTSNKPIKGHTTVVKTFTSKQENINIPFNLTTSFKPTDKVLYHCNAGDKEAFVDDTFLFGVQAWIEPSPEWIDQIAYDADSNERYSIRGHLYLEGEFNVELTGQAANQRTWKGNTLLYLNKTSGGGIVKGDMPDLKPGKITLIYQVQKPTLPGGTYDEDHKGIEINPFKPGEFPNISLRGKKDDEVLSFKQKGCKSSTFVVYEAECTKEQFENWEIYVSLYNTLDEAEQTTILDKLGVTIWAVNTEYLPQ